MCTQLALIFECQGRIDCAYGSFQKRNYRSDFIIVLYVFMAHQPKT